MDDNKKNIGEAGGIYEKIEELMGIDLRSLGLFRIGVGCILIVDLINRATALVAHYTDVGVAPRSLVVDYGEQPWFLSFHMLSGEPGLQIVLFILAGISAFALMMGYKSRFFCFMCWILTLSLHVRNPFVNNLGDWLLVDLLFWGMFLPLGARYSIDTLRRPADQMLPVRVLSIASLAILLQLGFMYFFSVMDKFTPAWRVDGTAVEIALNLERIVSGVGLYLQDLPDSWLKFMTFATIYLERWGPVLVFVPFLTGPIRSGVAFTFMGFHLMLAIFFEIGVFPYLCMLAWILYMPAWFWDKVGIWGEGVRKYADLLKGKVTGVVDFFFVGERRSMRMMPAGWETAIGALALLAMLSSNLLYGGLMGEAYYEVFYKHIEPVVNTLNMKQRWDMFSPQPPKNDGWFVVAAYNKDGTVEDVFHPGEDIVWDRPAIISATYSNQRWRKYLEWVMSKKGPFADSFAQYSAVVYQTKQPKSRSLDHVSVYLMEKLTLPDLTVSGIARKELSKGK